MWVFVIKVGGKILLDEFYLLLESDNSGKRLHPLKRVKDLKERVQIQP